MRGASRPEQTRTDRVPGLVWVTVIFLVAALPTLAWALTVPGYTIWPDELGYVRGTTYVSEHLRLVPPGDLYYTSASQLLQVVLAPLQALFGGVGGVRAAHALFALVIASSALPGWLLCRELALGPRASLVGAALVTGTSWLSFAGTITTEALAWPLFLWALLALLRAVAEPSDVRDAVALVAVLVASFARIQFVVLGAVLVGAIVIDAVARRRNPRTVVSNHQVIVAAVVALVLLGAAAFALGRLPDPLGAYRDIADQSDLGADQARSARDHWVYLLLATGIVPVIAATAWVPTNLRGNPTRERGAFAALALLLAIVVVAQVGVFGAGFLEGSVAGRYVFYLAVPAFLVLLICLEERRPRAWAAAAATALAALIMAGVNIDALSTAVRAPEAGSGGQRSSDGSFVGVPHARPLLTIVVLAAGLATWLLCTRLRARTGLAAVAVVLLALGVGSAALRMRSIHAESVSKDIVAQRGWIDATGTRPEQVALLLGPLGSDRRTELTWKSDAFFNRAVAGAWMLPGAPAYDHRFSQTAEVDERRGELLPPTAGVTAVVMPRRDPRLSLRGRVLRSYGGRILVRTTSRPRLAYFASGVDSAGRVGPRARLLLYAGPARTVGVRGLDRDGRARELRVRLAASQTRRIPLAERFRRIDEVR